MVALYPRPPTHKEILMTESTHIPQSQLDNARKIAQFLHQRLSAVIIGQKRVIDEVLCALLCGGHVLLEGVPGTGKTLLVRTLAHSFSGQFNRIQFTPDLMPTDVTGSYWYNEAKGAFELRSGPAFTNLLLADEINRAPAKTQASLLEVMQEYAITLDGKSHPIDLPFMVLATQNPIEQEGTYPLPEAQLDRFMFKILIDYPTLQDEITILKAVTQAENNNLLHGKNTQQNLSPQHIQQLQKITAKVLVDEALIDYAVRLVHATRNDHGLSVGAGPRAGIALINGARANALLQGRTFATPDDIKTIFLPTMRHRVRLSIEMEMEGQQTDAVLQTLLSTVEAPRQ